MSVRTSSTPSPARATPATQPLTDVRVLLLDSLNDRWKTFRAELKRCQKQFSEAAVHDLRVATRRLLSTLDLLASVHPNARLRQARRALKGQLDMFGPLRDVQVQLLTVDKMLAAFPELKGFYDFLVQRERKLVRRLGAEVKKVEIDMVKKAIRGAIKQV